MEVCTLAPLLEDSGFGLMSYPPSTNGEEENSNVWLLEDHEKIKTNVENINQWHLNSFLSWPHKKFGGECDKVSRQM